MILRRVIGIVSDSVESGGDRGLIRSAAHHSAEIVGDKLVGPAIFADQRSLPTKKICHSHLLPAAPLEFVTGAGGIVARGHVGPVVHILAPIVQEPGLVERIGGSKLLLKMLDES